jgi:DnaJ-class molecular chaperone
MRKKTLYEDLEVDKGATPETIKKAFRKKAKQTHPDNGGKSDEFRTIAKAYNILSDEEKRKRYDNGENPDNINQSNTHEQRVLNIVFSIFNNIVDQNIDLVHHNLFELMRQSIRANQQNFKSEKDRNQNNIERYNNILKRIKKKDKSTLFIQLLDDKIKGCNAIIIQLDENINVCDDALKLIEECEYETETQYIRFQYTGSTTAAGW